jgi:hypothetical protein
MIEAVEIDGEKTVGKFRLGFERPFGQYLGTHTHCVLALRLKEENELFPISGFPATLQELKKRSEGKLT